MRLLLATTGLGAIAAATAAVPANAETVISTAVTTPQSTSASGDIRISSTGSVKPTSGIGVTLNSNNYVRNEGTIQITGANNSAGIVANPSVTGEITNSGSITIDETYTATDTDNDGDIDGLFAQGSGRFGIHALGAFTGNITNSGSITIEGNQSAGIALDGPLTGNLVSSGSITILGNDSYGIKAGNVSGNVTLSKGTITVQGGNSVGVALNGNIGGALVIQNTIQTTGYRYTTVPNDTSKLDADDLLQGGSALVIGGNVAGGILFDKKPADNIPNNDDEDADGVPDAQETTATIISLGAAPAVVVGSSTQATTIGAVANSGGRGFVMKGSVTANGLYSGVAGNGIVIGGLGQSVNVTGGMTISGSVGASATNANATGIRIGSGATVPVIEVSGSVAAAGGGTASTGATAIAIDAGANVSTIKNSGAILAGRGGSDGTATAIIDNAGTVSLIENSGAISVGNAATLGDKAIAFDLRANGSGVTVRQLAVAATASAPTIDGTMLFGNGNDVFDIADGKVNGTAKFGAGNNQLLLSGDAVMNGAVDFGAGSDTLQLSGTSAFNGNVNFGGGADTLTLTGTSIFTGQLSGSAGLAVNLGAGTKLQATNLGTVGLASLTTGAGSGIGVTIDSSTHQSTLYNITGAANFGAGTSLDVKLLSLGGVAGTYKVIQAGTLTGAGNLVTSVNSIPFLFDSSLVTTTPNEVSVTIRQKTASELGLNASEGSVLNAVLGAADSDQGVAGVFLGASNSTELRTSLQQMLPDHSGGAFETATKGSRLTNKIFTDPEAPVIQRGALGFWLQQVAWGSSKSIGATSSYDVSGWGASGGVETSLGSFGNVGGSLAYLAGRDKRDVANDELVSSQYEGGVYWRGTWGPIRAYARGTLGRLDFDGTRFFSGVVNGQTVTREAQGEWKGTLYSVAAGVSYDARFGNFSIRPTATIEHFSLSEKGYTETGGGTAFDLIVDSRKSDETAASGTVALGYEIVRAREAGDGFLRVELEGGHRQILSGKLGATTAHFANGTPFTLTPEDRTSGWLAGFRLTGGGDGLAVTGELNAEDQQDKVSLGGRLGLQFSF
ncbi:autotransporter outer membrane beta-barrel domain-containing protein [Sphingomonas daechungensis]|uniref:autotransporter outer membrane beta-barrel domain-containing protein n=1 Tax=Sphingomonas daechungensis TaxID=1176646 RepID=UPI0031E76F26